MSDSVITIKAMNNRTPGGKEKFKGIGDLYYIGYVGKKSVNIVCKSNDEALISALGYKYDGPNTQFHRMAVRMLNMPSTWDEKV